MRLYAGVAAAFFIGSAIVCTAPSAWGAEPTHAAAAAEALFREGRSLVQAGRWADACPKFAESQRLDPGAGTALNLGACYVKLEKYASAWAIYREAQTLAAREGHREREQFAAARSKELEKKFGRVTITVTPRIRGLVVTNDGETVGEASWGTPMPIDPGMHAIEASAPGFKRFKQSIEIVAGATSQIEIAKLEVDPAAPAPSTQPPREQSHPPPPPPPTPEPASSASLLPTLGWVGIGVGATSIAGGTVFGLIAMSKNNAAQADGHCNERDCDAQGVKLTDEASSAATVSTILFAAGAVVAVVGAVLVLTAPSGTSRSGAASSRSSSLSWRLLRGEF